MMKYLRDLIITVLIAAAIFFTLHLTVGAIKIYGTSSYPNIQPGDFILMEKVSYYFRDPQRGEMIILHAPYADNTDLIKRVIGIPIHPNMNTRRRKSRPVPILYWATTGM